MSEKPKIDEMTDEQLITYLRDCLRVSNERIAELENAMQGRTMFCAGCEASARRIAELESLLGEGGR